jgi:hypothetical protein
VSVLQPEIFNFQTPASSSPKSSPKVTRKVVESTPQPALEPVQDGKPLALAANDLDYLQSAAAASSANKKTVKDFFVKTLEDIGISTSPKQERRSSGGVDPLSGWINQRKSQDLGVKPTSSVVSPIAITSITTATEQTQTPAKLADPLIELIAKLPDLSYMLSPKLVTTK